MGKQLSRKFLKTKDLCASNFDFYDKGRVTGFMGFYGKRKKGVSHFPISSKKEKGRRWLVNYKLPGD